MGGGGGAVLGACGGGGLPNGLTGGLPWAETGLEAPNMAFPTMGLPNMGYAPGDMAHVREGRTGLEPVLQLLPA